MDQKNKAAQRGLISVDGLKSSKNEIRPYHISLNIESPFTAEATTGLESVFFFTKLKSFRSGYNTG